MGYNDIQDVRNAVTEGKITMTRNALLGMKYYEDFLDKMDRVEVERIRDIVSQTCLSRYPESQLQAMGSFRRGEQSFGDVDILIVNHRFQETTPPNALMWLRDKLLEEGHIAHHLTDILARPVRDDDMDHPLNPVQDGHSGVQTYMGIFNSPVHAGKKRRIDIKFYPYQCRAFAYIYFTGNTMFNRSIRMYATKVKRLHLSDRALRPIVKTGHEVLTCGKNEDFTSNTSLKAESEQDVFEHLGLIYQEPTQRDGFAAVIPKSDVNGTNTNTPSLGHLSENRTESNSSEDYF